MKIIPCTSIWNGNASIGTDVLDQLKAENETFAIRHKRKLMTIDPIEYYKFWQQPNPKKYPHTDGRSGFYTLKYIQWKPDEEQKTE